LLGSEGNGLHTVAVKAANVCTLEHQKALYNNIVLAGGSSRFPGLASRLQKELTSIVGSTMDINVREPITNTENLEPSAWLGGSILSSLSSFQPMWITRQEYDEIGPSIVHKKCDHL
jgi:actin-related protein